MDFCINLFKGILNIRGDKMFKSTIKKDNYGYLFGSEKYFVYLD
ncbi:hypothetical protein SAMN02746089_02788 [Caldanaerobius fijiensis DSM 17918]|uniref:Uncharacterized protein n=1 Tax=Caldanaerobius fijiensis DSM 17918 TaxID=1121256 RepID=A0A1M5FNV4_9THEO|nr:hypothetical protein SAMN02746089_02788 [Caldanaerobius fijiensis DSM 17918]